MLASSSWPWPRGPGRGLKSPGLGLETGLDYITDDLPYRTEIQIQSIVVIILPADQESIRAKLVIAIYMPDVVWPSRSVCSSSQPMSLASYNTDRI